MKHYLSRHNINQELLILSLLFFLGASTTALVIFAGEFNLTPFIAEFVITAYCLAICGLALKRSLQLPRDKAMGLSVLIGAQVFWFAAPALIVVLGWREWFAERLNYPVSDQSLVLAAGYLTMFAVLTLGTYQLMRRRVLKNSTAQILPYKFSTKKILFIVIGLVGLGILPFFIYSDSIGEMLAGIRASRAGIDKGWHQTAFESRPFQVIGRAALVAASNLALFQLLRSNRIFHRLGWGSIFIIGFLITYLDSGTRTWTAMILVPPILVFVRERISGHSAKFWMVGGLIAVVGIALVAQFQLSIRNTGLRDTDQLMNADSMALYDNDFFTETAVAVDLVPTKMDYVLQSNTILFLVNPIPRSLWQDKPYPKVIEQYTIGRSGINEYRETGVSRMPSIVGQHYMAWGIPGIIGIAILIGMFLGWVDHLWSREPSTPFLKLWAATASVWIFLSFRGMFPGFHWPVLIFGAIVLLERRKGKKIQFPKSSRALRVPQKML